jgi:outer membrane phospholipase A
VWALLPAHSEFKFETLNIIHMKTSKYQLISLVVVLMCPVLVSAQSANSKEIAAIKAVIEKETLSFFNVNKQDWEDSWWKVPYAYWSYSDSTGTSFIEGWDNIAKNFSDYFKTQVSNRPIDVAHQSTKLTIERVWHDIRVYGTGAYVHYTQKVFDNVDRDETSQIRVLEKKDGKWKVIVVGAVAFYPND